jgi:putative membrane protein
VIGLHTRVSEWLGLGLLLVGALIIVGATQRFYRNRCAVEVADSSPYGDSWIARVMSGLLIIMALFLILYVARQIAALS